MKRAHLLDAATTTREHVTAPLRGQVAQDGTRVAIQFALRNARLSGTEDVASFSPSVFSIVSRRETCGA
jgi:hypothetical protein